MSMQLDIFQRLVAEGEALKLAGMQQAVDHADQAPPWNWSDKAYAFLSQWLDEKPVGYWFMAEDVRRKAIESGKVPQPPSDRAWGAIIAKAKRDGLIISNGTQKVSNPKAHQANACVWVKVLKGYKNYSS